MDFSQSTKGKRNNHKRLSPLKLVERTQSKETECSLSAWSSANKWYEQSVEIILTSIVIIVLLSEIKIKKT